MGAYLADFGPLSVAEAREIGWVVETADGGTYAYAGVGAQLRVYAARVFGAPMPALIEMSTEAETLVWREQGGLAYLIAPLTPALMEPISSLHPYPYDLFIGNRREFYGDLRFHPGS